MRERRSLPVCRGVSESVVGVCRRWVDCGGEKVVGKRTAARSACCFSWTSLTYELPLRMYLHRDVFTMMPDFDVRVRLIGVQVKSSQLFREGVVVERKDDEGT